METDAVNWYAIKLIPLIQWLRPPVAEDQNRTVDTALQQTLAGLPVDDLGAAGMSGRKRIHYK
jgi:hypothetical protein